MAYFVGLLADATRKHTLLDADTQRSARGLVVRLLSHADDGDRSPATKRVLLSQQAFMDLLLLASSAGGADRDATSSNDFLRVIACLVDSPVDSTAPVPSMHRNELSSQATKENEQEEHEEAEAATRTVIVADYIAILERSPEFLHFCLDRSCTDDTDAVRIACRLITSSSTMMQAFECFVAKCAKPPAGALVWAYLRGLYAAANSCDSPRSATALGAVQQATVDKLYAFERKSEALVNELLHARYADSVQQRTAHSIACDILLFYATLASRELFADDTRQALVRSLLRPTTDSIPVLQLIEYLSCRHDMPSGGGGGGLPAARHKELLFLVTRAIDVFCQLERESRLQREQADRVPGMQHEQRVRDMYTLIRMIGRVASSEVLGASPPPKLWDLCNKLFPVALRWRYSDAVVLETLCQLVCCLLPSIGPSTAGSGERYREQAQQWHELLVGHSSFGPTLLLASSNFSEEEGEEEERHGDQEELDDGTTTTTEDERQALGGRAADHGGDSARQASRSAESLSSIAPPIELLELERLFTAVPRVPTTTTRPSTSNEEQTARMQPRYQLVRMLYAFLSTMPELCSSNLLVVLLSAYGCRLHPTDRLLLLAMLEHERHGIALGAAGMVWSTRAREALGLNNNNNNNTNSNGTKSDGSGDVATPYSMAQLLSDGVLFDRSVLTASTSQFPSRLSFEALSGIGDSARDGASSTATVRKAVFSDIAESAWELYDPSYLLPFVSYHLLSAPDADIRRLVDMGLISYTLMATSSHDGTMRELAFRCLSQATGLTERTRFNERYQVLGILQVLQNSITRPNLRVSSITATFFARAMSLMLHPESSVYVWLNRAIWKRPVISLRDLPLFRELFHSESDEHHRGERLWMLKTIAFVLKQQQQQQQLQQDCKVLVEQQILKRIMAYHDTSILDPLCKQAAFQVHQM